MAKFDNGDRVRFEIPSMKLAGEGFVRGLPEDNGGYYWVVFDTTRVAIAAPDYVGGILCEPKELEYLK